MKSKIIIIIIIAFVFTGLFMPVDVSDGTRVSETGSSPVSDKLKQARLFMPDSTGDDSEFIDAAAYLAPGVYVEEIPGMQSIQAVETAVAGFMGQTERGPLEPQFIASFSQYESLYGGYTDASYLPYAVKGFFDNGGQKLYVARIVSAQAAIAEMMITDGKRSVASVEALSPGGIHCGYLCSK